MRYIASFGIALAPYFFNIQQSTIITVFSVLNQAEITAKDESQYALASLFGSGIGILFLYYTVDRLHIFYGVVLLGIAQVIMTLLFVHYTHFENLNFSRLRVLAHNFKKSRRVFRLNEIRNCERFTGESLTNTCLNQLDEISVCDDLRHVKNDPNFEMTFTALKKEKYYLKCDSNETLVAFSEDVGSRDFILAILHATYAAQTGIVHGYAWANEDFGVFYQGLENAGWNLNYVVIGGGIRYVRIDSEVTCGSNESVAITLNS